MIYGDAKMDTRQSLAYKVRNSFTEVKDSLREYVAMPAVKYIILPASLAVGGAALEEGVINTSNAYAQTAPNERSTISQVTASPERKELSDLVASPTLNGPDTALLSWTQPDGEFKDYEVQVGKQFYKFSPNDVKEKDGKKQVLLGQVEGKNGETLPVELKGNGYSTVTDGKAIMTLPQVYIELDLRKGEK